MSRAARRASLAILLCAVGCGGADKKKDLAEIQDAEWHYKSGAGYFQNHQVPLAIRELHTALTKEPGHARAHYLMGYILMGRRDYPKAVTHFRAALKTDPSFHDARNALGATYLAQERWEEAVELFEELLEEPLYTSPELAHNNAGWAYYKLGRSSRALEHFRMATFLKPQFCLGHNNTGLAQSEIGDVQAAMRSWAKATELCPTNYAEPHFHLAKQLIELGDPERARAHFRRCTSLSPSSNLGDRCRAYLLDEAR